MKVFGIGLSRTGTYSLSKALDVLGFYTIHYPIDPTTLLALFNGDAAFPVLNSYDGITDITVCPYYKQLDRRYQGSKFILTVRDIESWTKSCENYWRTRPPFDEDTRPRHATHMNIRRFLRAAVYGSYNYSYDRFVSVYQDYVDSVLNYFKNRPNDLLVLNIIKGEGYEKLAPFMGVDMPDSSFPNIPNIKD